LYRYEIEKTSKIKAPFWSPFEAIIDSDSPQGVTTISGDD
jgi:hypothetical protein